MKYYCKWCGTELIKLNDIEGNTDYKCPKHPNEIFKVRNGVLLSFGDLFLKDPNEQFKNKPKQQ